MFLDLVMFNLSFIIAYLISVLIYGPLILPMKTYINLIVFSNFILLSILGSFGLYGTKRGLFDSEDFYVLLKSIVLCYFIITAATFLSRSMDYSRLIVTNTFVISFLLITVSRSLLNVVLVKLRVRGLDRQKAGILGKTDSGESILARLNERPALGYEFAGFYDFTPHVGGKLRMDGVKTVFVAVPSLDQEKLIDLVAECEDIEFKIVPDLVKLISEPLSFDEFRDIPLITIREQKTNMFYANRLKRLFDVCFSVLLLVFLSPLFFIVGLLIKLDSRGPVFFKQVRVGKDGKEFLLFKFRTMREDAEEARASYDDLNEVKGLFKMKDDPRVIEVGYFLRRTCVDELPQLINIVKGDMSLVGPRPHLQSEMRFFGGWRRERFKVKPGLTGLWQVSGRHELDFDKAVLMDIYYIKHMSFFLDLKILVKTIPSIIYSEGRW